MQESMAFVINDGLQLHTVCLPSWHSLNAPDESGLLFFEKLAKWRGVWRQETMIRTYSINKNIFF